MGKGAALRWLENQYLRRYLHGCGMEIGALWRRFPVPARARVWYIDRLTTDDLVEQYPELRGKIIRPDLIAEATQLPVAKASLNFLIASHIIEHLPFPLVALRRWYEALAPQGALLLRVPDMRYTFDTGRARTPLTHLIQEHEHPERFDRRAHYADWVKNVQGRKPEEPEFEQDIQSLIDRNYSIHYHAWIDQDVREMIDYTQEAWRLDWKPVVFWGAHFYRKETTALLVRQA